MAGGVWAGLELRRRWGLRRGAAAPGFALDDQTGRTWTLEALLTRRKPLVLILSHSACGACRALLPDFARWQRELEGRLTVMVVSGGRLEDNLVEAREHACVGC